MITVGRQLHAIAAGIEIRKRIGCRLQADNNGPTPRDRSLQGGPNLVPERDKALDPSWSWPSLAFGTDVN